MQAKYADADADGYREVAKKVVEEYVSAYQLDGLDVDMEVPNLERAAWTKSAEDRWRIRKIMAALSEELGPKAAVNSGKTKNDDGYKFLIYDTFDDVQRSQIQSVAELVDYVLPQTYKSGADQVNQLWEKSKGIVSSCQFVPGYAHPEEGDRVNRFETAIGDVESSKAMQVARWQPTGGEKGGAFVYAIDRDGRTYNDDDLKKLKETDFSFSKRGAALARPQAFTAAKEKAQQSIDAAPSGAKNSLKAKLDKALTFEEVEAVDAEAQQAIVQKKDASLDTNQKSPSEAQPSADTSPATLAKGSVVGIVVSVIAAVAVALIGLLNGFIR